MSQKYLSRQRIVCAAGITLALLSLATSASAQEAPVQSTDSITVSRDAETGKLRAATPEEVNALKAAGAARGARLTDEFLSQSVAVRQPDGSVAEQCFDSHDAANNAVAVAHVHTHQVEK
jgi:hypothetical protein